MTIKFETTIDENIVEVMPKLRPLLGQRVEVIAVKSAQAGSKKKTRSLDEFLTHRLKRPDGMDPVTFEDMERAIAKGSLDSLKQSVARRDQARPLSGALRRPRMGSR